jgi:PAS domain S-box-containing protein
MESVVQESRTFYFLGDGGEMGRLTREFNWSTTAVGTPDHWPQSLKTVVSVILHSGFPMFLWWGDDMVQFYNDAYRPSLGNNGKHPKALGQNGKDCWPEIWSIIFPLIENVRNTGESFLAEDQLVPIYRNGKIEDVYWTFTYSPVIDEHDRIAGILVTCIETTEKVFNLKALQESKQQLQFAIDAAELGTWDYHPDTNKITANERTRQWFGLSGNDEIDISDAMKVVAERDRERVAAAITKALDFSSGGFYDIEYSVVDPVFQQERILRGKGHALFDKDRKAYRFNGTLQDVTLNAAARQQIENSERNLRNLILQAPVAMCLLKGKDFVVEVANDRILEIWGKEPYEVLHQPIFEGLPEAKEQGLEQLLDQVLTTGERFVANELAVSLPREGKVEVKYLDFVYEAFRDHDNKITGVMAVAIDVTEKVTAREKIQHSEKVFRNLVLNAPIGICVLDGPSRVCEIVNEKFIDVAGKPYEAIMGKHYWESFAEAAPYYESALTDVVENGVTFFANEVELMLIRHGKEENIFVTFVYAPIKDIKGHVSKVVVWVLENTDQVMARRRVEDLIAERTKELQIANQALQTSNLELQQFAYIASHDLQEPARKIVTFSEMLRKNSKDIGGKELGYLDKIENASTRMLRLIRDVLNFSQLAIKSTEFIPVDLNETLASVKEDYELLIAENGALIENDTLPHILAIPIQMSQLFGNLISNSLKFTINNKTPVIRITVSEIDADEISRHNGLNAELAYYKISFVDNGIGFNQSNATQIFDIFQRLHSTNEYKGTGIGLAMCKKICQNHGGDIYAESNLGQGATFHVMLPKS